MLAQVAATTALFKAARINTQNKPLEYRPAQGGAGMRCHFGCWGGPCGFADAVREEDNGRAETTEPCAKTRKGLWAMTTRLPTCLKRESFPTNN